MPVLSKRFESENYHSFSLKLSKNATNDKSESAWRSQYTFDREPVGRGFAGKVYKIFPKNKECVENIFNSIDGNSFTDSGDDFAATYYACKAIRRWRCGKDTIYRIKRELKAMYRLQTNIDEWIFRSRCQDSALINDITNMSHTKSRLPSPPASAAPKLISVHEDSREVAIVMEFAHGGSLYDLCKTAYDHRIRSHAGYCSCAVVVRPTHCCPANHNGSQNCPPCGDTAPMEYPSASPRRVSEPCRAGQIGLPETYVIQVVQKLLEAVSYMHRHLQMVHLDIKAENVLLRQCYPSTDVFLTDFGLATELTENKEHRELAGTPDYAAPEIINYDPITFATDMWSVGVLTYFLLTGVSPFLAEEKELTMQNVTHGSINYPEELFAHRSTKALQFLRGLLVRKPSERLSAEQCLRHPWLQSSHSDELSQPVSMDSTESFMDSSSSSANTDVFPADAETLSANTNELVPVTVSTPGLASTTPCLSSNSETTPDQSLQRVPIVCGDFTNTLFRTIMQGLSEIQLTRLTPRFDIRTDPGCVKLYQLIRNIRYQTKPIVFHHPQLAIDQAPWIKPHQLISDKLMTSVDCSPEVNETACAVPTLSQISRVEAPNLPTVRQNETHCVEVHVKLIAPSVAMMTDMMEHSCSALIYLSGYECSVFGKKAFSLFQGLDNGNGHLRNHLIYSLKNNNKNDTINSMCTVSMSCLYLASLTSFFSVPRTAVSEKFDHGQLTAPALEWNAARSVIRDRRLCTLRVARSKANNKVKASMCHVVRSLRDSFGRAVRLVSTQSLWPWFGLHKPRRASV